MDMLKTFWPMIKAVLLGQGRALLSTVGGILIAQGVLTNNQENDFIGSCFFLMTLGFTAFDKFVVDKKIKVAAASPVISTITVAGKS